MTRPREGLSCRLPPGHRVLDPYLAFFQCLFEAPLRTPGLVYSPGPSTLLTTPFPRKSPTETPRITESLSSSFLEHTRREWHTANTCIVCSASFQTNSGLESHAKSTGHSAFSCTCDTSFGRRSSLERHINSNTGSGYHCGLCENRTLPRIDKLYDHLRDGHKVSQKVLDRYRNKALGRIKKPLQTIKPTPTPAATPEVTHFGGFDPAWSHSGQINGTSGRHVTPLSPNGVNPTQLTVRPLGQDGGCRTGILRRM